VKVLYDEDVASHIAPKPCVVTREGQGEASAGERAGWPSRHESGVSRVPTVLPIWKATRSAALARAAARPGVVRDPACTDAPCPGTGRSLVRPAVWRTAGPHREGRMAVADDERTGEVRHSP
jgi:hypothetical protein